MFGFYPKTSASYIFGSHFFVVVSENPFMSCRMILSYDIKFQKGKTKSAHEIRVVDQSGNKKSDHKMKSSQAEFDRNAFAEYSKSLFFFFSRQYHQQCQHMAD